MMNKELELRKYMFVPYNISSIQQGIQAGHASDKYGQEYKDDKINIDFVNNHMTWMVMNGGTTRDGHNEESRGDLNNIEVEIIKHNAKIEDDESLVEINYTIFREPDLNYALTAICFICDERVFNYDDYIDFKNYCKITLRDAINHFSYDNLKETFPDLYQKWTDEIMGGKTNVFLRELLKGKKFA